MPGLVDIAPRVEAVDIRGTEIRVQGLPAAFIAEAMGRIPELRAALADSGPEIDDAALFAACGAIVGEAIACGLGMRGDAETIKLANGMAIEDQFSLIGGIMKATAPDGLGPLLGKLGLNVEEDGDGGQSSSAPASK